MYAREMYAHEVHACEMHVYEVHTHEMHACEVSRAPRREAVVVVEENISRDSRRETDSETRSMSTDDGSGGL
jgi:hypothetical protein